jgi:hypothetical protein
VTSRTRPCDAALIEGRRRKAEQFLAAAQTVRELADDEAGVGDAFVTLCVHAGVAAADVLCCRAWGTTSRAMTTTQPSRSSRRWGATTPATCASCSA